MSDVTKYTYLNFSKSFGVANSVFIPFTGEQTKIQRNAQLRLTHVFKALRIFLDAVDGFCQGDQLGRGGGVRLRAAVKFFWGRQWILKWSPTMYISTYFVCDLLDALLLS